MTRSEVYNALKLWLQNHGFDDGYRLQKREWREREGAENERYLIIQQAGGGSDEEAVMRDNFRFILLSGQNDGDVDGVEDRADAIRQAMLDDYKIECIISMRPIGGVTSVKTEEGRFLFVISFQTIISR